MKNYKKITLTEKEMPTNWYNIVADMANKPLPHLNPATKQPAKKEDFYPIFAQELVEQEFSQERYIVPKLVYLMPASFPRFLHQYQWRC